MGAVRSYCCRMSMTCLLFGIILLLSFCKMTEAIDPPKATDMIKIFSGTAFNGTPENWHDFIVTIEAILTGFNVASFKPDFTVIHDSNVDENGFTENQWKFADSQIFLLLLHCTSDIA